MKLEKERKYRQALELWLENNPGKNINQIPGNEIVILPNQEPVKLGSRILEIRCILRNKSKGKLTEEQRNYWVLEQGLQPSSKAAKEEIYCKALELWLKEHPGKDINNIPATEVVFLPGVGKVFLGNRIFNFRQILKGNISNYMTDSQKAYWISKHGLFPSSKEAREKKYQEAFELWLKKHPGRNVNQISKKEIVVLPTGEEIPLGTRIVTLKNILRGNANGIITPEQRAYWIEEYGLVGYYKKNGEENREFFFDKDQELAVSMFLSYLGISVDYLSIPLVFKKVRDFNWNLGRQVEALKDFYDSICLKIIKKSGKPEKVLSDFLSKEGASLSNQELRFFLSKIKQYLSFITLYRQFDVLFTDEEEEKMKKIKKYHLKEKEIRNLFYLPYLIDQKLYPGKKGKEYQREELIYAYVCHQKEYTLDEKRRFMLQYDIYKEDIQKAEEKIKQYIKMTKM